MLGSFLAGITAAVCVALTLHLQSLGTGLVPAVLLGITALAMIFQKFLIDRHPVGRIYEGLPDLFVHIHTPSVSDQSWRWMIRGLISLLFVVFGGLVGAEGPAIEFGYSLLIKLRTRSARWFEQRRRTDVASALAAGISASFGAPFAAVLIPMEMGVGGRTLHSAMASLTAFVGLRYFAGILPVKTFELGGALYGFSLADWHEWLAVVLIAVSAGAAGAATIVFVRYAKESLFRLYSGKGWVRILLGGVFLFLIISAYRGGFAPTRGLLEDVLWARRSTGEASLLLFSRFLLLSVLLSTFGTAGIFWPLFGMGGFLGFVLNQVVFNDIPGFAAASGMVGASAFLGAVLGVPLSAAVLGFEMTHNLHLVLPCFVAGWIAREVMRLLKVQTLVDVGLRARGLRLVEGRSSSVLESIRVSDAMVSDIQTFKEHEAVSELEERLFKSKYPFLPVTGRGDKYLGMLTLDLIQEAWHTDETVTSNSSLSKLLEVKDLLYRSSYKAPSIRAEQRLSEVSQMMDHFPCLPVVTEEGTVAGLLLVQNVRQAYDREVVRRSLELATLSPGV